MSCDVPPGEITSGIMVEWMRAGGVGLYRKEIQAFNTYSPFVILLLSINVSVQTLLAEFRRLLEEAKNLLAEEAMIDDAEPITVIPHFAFWKSLPKLPGLDPADYAGLSTKQTATRRAWHLEMETQHVPTFWHLIETCKKFVLIEDLWGAHVLVSEVVDYDSPPGDIARLQKEAKNHTCFQVSMTCTQLYGILDIDAAVPYKLPGEGEEAGGLLSMRQVLPKHFRTRDNKSPLFAEIHQRQNGAPVEVVIPNTREAEAMLGDMNWLLPAFIKFYLEEKGLEKDFVTRLIVAACCLSLVAKINTVTWDPVKQNLLELEDSGDKGNLSAFESQEWYFDLQKLRVSPKKKGTTMLLLKHYSIWMLTARSPPFTLRMMRNVPRRNRDTVTLIQKRKMRTPNPTRVFVGSRLMARIQTIQVEMDRSRSHGHPALVLSV